jgi:hypothetical protein
MGNALGNGQSVPPAGGQGRLSMAGVVLGWGWVLVLGWGGFLAAPSAHASFIMTLTESGSDVVGVGSGTLNITGLTNFGPLNVSALMVPTIGNCSLGPTSATGDTIYHLTSGPTSFGSGGQTHATSGSGDEVGIQGNNSSLFVPAGYVSGASLSDNATWTGKSFATLGITPGTYTWTAGGGDTFTLQVGPVTPEPSLGGAALIALGARATLWRGRRGRRGGARAAALVGLFQGS